MVGASGVVHLAEHLLNSVCTWNRYLGWHTCRKNGLYRLTFFGFPQIAVVTIDIAWLTSKRNSEKLYWKKNW